jgi:hypothetical protein
MLKLSDLVVGQEVEVTRANSGLEFTKHLGNRYKVLELRPVSSDDEDARITFDFVSGTIPYPTNSDQIITFNLKSDERLRSSLSIASPFRDGQRVRVKETRIVACAGLEAGEIYTWKSSGFDRSFWQWELWRRGDSTSSCVFNHCHLPELREVLEPLDAPDSPKTNKNRRKPPAANPLVPAAPIIRLRIRTRRGAPDLVSVLSASGGAQQTFEDNDHDDEFSLPI